MEKNNQGIKSHLFSLILCAFSLLFLVLYLVKVDGLSAAAIVLKQTRIAWLFAAVGCIIVYWLLEAYALQLTLKIVYPKQQFRDTLHISMIGQFFNNITPFASGGQPMQAYFLTRRGTALGSSMTALLTKFIVYQITLTMYCLVTIILRFSFFAGAVHDLIYLVLVGFAVSAGVTSFLIGAAFFKNGMIRAARIIIRVLAKIKIVKHPDTRLASAVTEIEKFNTQFKEMRSHKTMLIKTSLITVVQLTAMFLIGNVIYVSFGLSGADALTLIAGQAFVCMVSSYVPTPGAMGAAEGSFALFFGLFFPNKMISLAVVLWRLITFYLPIVVGLIFTVIEKRRAPVMPIDNVPAIDKTTRILEAQNVS
ncbi:MAG: lysylphosphatidylglycerol synthase transmembrane domain-containing protein [Eubacteriales bacterium]